MGRKTKTRTKKKGGDARMEDEKMSAKVDAMDEERMRVGGVGGDIDDIPGPRLALSRRRTERETWSLTLISTSM